LLEAKDGKARGQGLEDMFEHTRKYKCKPCNYDFTGNQAPAPLARNILRFPSTKSTEFELIVAKVRKKQKKNIFCCYFVIFRE